ncbi:rab11 family-interacting protein 1 isoform X3 [Macrosteles quadrilineatus]|uniref:rab11 family-interacting protein 1 isoform X3 n=1 Tax=Macrosteles quadrilineatus TaxID=74068 RepID=UPI0023E28639|nr:rab11 family-interacting protein 1 isoform X3 [Macrosteles quadrilineatus]
MWSPTHVQVTVQKARGLLAKGKNGTNDAFVTIGLGKDKYQTSIKEKATENVEWHEKCELQIPKQGNTAEIVLTVLHHSFLGVDEFLGCVSVPLAEMDVYERPRNRWYKLKGKPGKEKNKEGKERGELEVKISFIVKSGSLADLSKKEKHKSSLGQLSTALGGSLISISSLDKRKGLKKFAKSFGQSFDAGMLSNKISGKSKSKEKDFPETGSLHEVNKLSRGGVGLSGDIKPSLQRAGDADPGVISEGESEDGFTLDDLSHKGSGYSLEANSTPKSGSLENLAGGEILRRSENTPPAKPPRTIVPPPEPVMDEWEQKLYGKYGKDFKKSPTLSHPSKTSSSKSSMERIIIGGETDSFSAPRTPLSRLNPEILKKFDGKSREDLIETIMDLQNKVSKMNQQQRDLEDYLDQLLLRVMETSPRILQNPYMNCKTQAQCM